MWIYHLGRAHEEMKHCKDIDQRSCINKKLIAKRLISLIKLRFYHSKIRRAGSLLEEHHKPDMHECQIRRDEAHIQR